MSLNVEILLIIVILEELVIRIRIDRWGTWIWLRKKFIFIAIWIIEVIRVNHWISNLTWTWNPFHIIYLVLFRSFYFFISQIELVFFIIIY